MYIFCITMICIASVLLILAVLVQSPKSGMAANFGAANQTMGVRQTTDFLEKFTWAMVAAVVFFSLLSTTANPSSVAGEGNVNDEAMKMAVDKVNQEENKSTEATDETKGIEGVDFENINVEDAEAAGETAPAVEETAPVVEETTPAVKETTIEPEA